MLIRVSLCEKFFSRVKIHKLEVMKIANLHFVSIKIMQMVIKKKSLPNPEINEQHEFKIFSGKDILSIDTTKTMNQMMLEHLYSNELARNVLPWERANHSVCYPLYCRETKTKFSFKGDVSNPPIICLSHVHRCNRKAGIT